MSHINTLRVYTRTIIELTKCPANFFCSCIYRYKVNFIGNPYCRYSSSDFFDFDR